MLYSTPTTDGLGALTGDGTWHVLTACPGTHDDGSAQPRGRAQPLSLVP